MKRNVLMNIIYLQQEFSKREVRESTYVVRDSSYSSVEEKQQQSFLSNRPPRDPTGGARSETDAAHARFRYKNLHTMCYYIVTIQYVDIGGQDTQFNGSVALENKVFPCGQLSS